MSSVRSAAGVAGLCADRDASSRELDATDVPAGPRMSVTSSSRQESSLLEGLTEGVQGIAAALFGQQVPSGDDGGDGPFDDLQRGQVATPAT